LLGQQNIGGERVRPQLNTGRRTLPHYPIDSSKMSQRDQYSAKGFIQNSFLKGLSPQEFWFHAMSGREGICDTALKTASSGYTQRRMVKIMEDVQIKYDQTVRNSAGSIIQFAYGDDNLCGTQSVLIRDDDVSCYGSSSKIPFMCDTERLVEQLNMDYELQNDII
jgi:DNA-directed RNA polymerase beta' subunit